eukprot:GHVL01043815.1.p1 GENE.GHVL01043815.1~~GHVL01043815.1.p1  ORF type:complete len:508 (+),score=99.74 GHVL01043815.1:63-1586(+)
MEKCTVCINNIADNCEKYGCLLSVLTLHGLLLSCVVINRPELVINWSFYNLFFWFFPFFTIFLYLRTALCDPGYVTPKQEKALIDWYLENEGQLLVPPPPTHVPPPLSDDDDDDDDDDEDIETLEEGLDKSDDESDDNFTVSRSEKFRKDPRQMVKETVTGAGLIVGGVALAAVAGARQIAAYGNRTVIGRPSLDIESQMEEDRPRETGSPTELIMSGAREMGLVNHWVEVDSDEEMEEYESSHYPAAHRKNRKLKKKRRVFKRPIKLKIPPGVAGYANPYRICHICEVYQPLRTKHCHECGRCVRCHDHHCPYIGSCVGEFNRVFFFWWLFFQFFELLFTFKEGCNAITDLLANDTPWGVSNFFLILSLVIIFFYTLMVICLVVYHAFLATANVTTWEHLSWYKISYLKRIDINDGTPFSKGCFSNWILYCIPMSCCVFLKECVIKYGGHKIGPSGEILWSIGKFGYIFYSSFKTVTTISYILNSSFIFRISLIYIIYLYIIYIYI